ncbi:hypothetical protein FHR32_003263 [Streptosporangium album]|uniref:Tn3 transposase DDE domain-containing protein n=1 Tax=Streptosporangium album TaxID=47479 RepID=A0A7W7RVD9_9ACTN|nr:Tn3 family transposase [Streptosporangium album]MBB4938958.1 hypothetical protein [Streptosporangium album]
MIVTDTASYSGIVFGLLTLAGFAYAPQPADLPDQKMWRIDRTADYGAGPAKLELPGVGVMWGKTGGRYGYLTGIGGVRNAADTGEPPRTLVYSYNSVDAKSEGEKPRTLKIIMAAFS